MEPTSIEGPRRGGLVARLSGHPHGVGLGDSYLGVRTADPEDLIQSGTVVVAAVGEVYTASRPGRAAPALLEAYLAGRIPAVTGVEGSFLAVIADIEVQSAWVVTDIVSSRAGYAMALDGEVWVSNSLADLPTGRFPLSLAGLAAYLACDGMRADLTPYEGITSLPPGSVTELSRRGAKPTVYWRHLMRPPETAPETARLRDEMIDLMRQSVRERTRSVEPGKLYLSLSGGYDSRGLLGFLNEPPTARSVEAFSYFHGRAVGDTDLPVAVRLAEMAGVPHRPVPGYGGDVAATLVDNGRRGEGVARFCDEADAWRVLASRAAGPGAVVVGDRQSHWLSSFADDLSTAATLGLVGLWPMAGAEWFLNRLDGEMAVGMRSGWTDRFDDLAASYDALGDWRHVIMTSYIEHRVARTFAAWRELFTAQVAQVLNPFLDRRLLDFVAQLPWELNDADGFLLHKAAIGAAFPGLAGQPSAQGGWNQPAWGDEIRRNASSVRSLLVDVPSRLAEVVPTGAVTALLEEVLTRRAPIRESTSGMAGVVRRVVRRSPQLRGMSRRRSLVGRTQAPSVTREQMLRRLVTLHLALADESQLPEPSQPREGG